MTEKIICSNDIPLAIEFILKAFEMMSLFLVVAIPYEGHLQVFTSLSVWQKCVGSQCE